MAPTAVPEASRHQLNGLKSGDKLLELGSLVEGAGKEMGATPSGPHPAMTHLPIIPGPLQVQKEGWSRVTDLKSPSQRKKLSGLLEAETRVPPMETEWDHTPPCIYQRKRKD